jgi:ribosome-associated heat shock protein Hsp15
MLNGVVTQKGRHLIRVGDIIAVPQGVLVRTILVKAVGSRRGPFTEAQLLYEEAAAPLCMSELNPPWKPLLVDE